MAKNPGRMALYEAVSKSRKKTSDSGSARKFGLVSFKNRLKKRNIGRKLASESSSSDWPPSTKPKSQAVKGRGPSSVLLIILLSVVLLAAVIGGIKLGSLWLAGAPTTDVQLYKRVYTGQIGQDGQENAVRGGSGEDAQVDGTGDADVGLDGVSKEEFLGPMADHRIVIATHTNAKDLEPVKEYFTKNGVETKIEKRPGYYFLLTKEKYANPYRKGSDGEVAMHNIKRIGVLYRAPKGYERFAATPFQDAYGEKIK